uniref:Uncharacterized protein n=1 Tax=Anguilla anguilla TaxID=7936 RepID=A0A0E9PRG5_ANGAN
MGIMYFLSPPVW